MPQATCVASPSGIQMQAKLPGCTLLQLCCLDRGPPPVGSPAGCDVADPINSLSSGLNPPGPILLLVTSMMSSASCEACCGSRPQASASSFSAILGLWMPAVVWKPVHTCQGAGEAAATRSGSEAAEAQAKGSGGRRRESGKTHCPS